MKDEAKDMFRTEYIHLSFAVGSQSEVDRLTGLLYDNGYRVVSGPRITGDGYYESCIEGWGILIFSIYPYLCTLNFK